MTDRPKVLGGKCGCPSQYCKGTMGFATPPRNVWLSRTNKHGHGYSRVKRRGKMR